MITTLRSPSRRPLRRTALRRARVARARCSAVTALVLSLAVLGACAAVPPVPVRASDMPTPPGTPTASASPMPPPQPPGTPLARGLPPTAVSIDAIGLAEPLIDLGLTADGAMEVPADFDDVGWFTGGGRPGGRGPLIIAAHVDSPTGPAVFLRLRELVPGDNVIVTDSAGHAHRYRVTEVADYPKAAFPTARVFGAVTTDELRLITCGGVFDSSAGSYEDNRVVYAERADG